MRHLTKSRRKTDKGASQFIYGELGPTRSLRTRKPSGACSRRHSIQRSEGALCSSGTKSTPAEAHRSGGQVSLWRSSPAFDKGQVSLWRSSPAFDKGSYHCLLCALGRSLAQRAPRLFGSAAAHHGGVLLDRGQSLIERSVRPWIDFGHERSR